MTNYPAGPAPIRYYMVSDLDFVVTKVVGHLSECGQWIATQDDASVSVHGPLFTCERLAQLWLQQVAEKRIQDLKARADYHREEYMKTVQALVRMEESGLG